MNKYYDVQVMVTGEIRVSAELWPEEQRWGMVMRGFSASEAMDMAAQLVKAAEQVSDYERSVAK